MPKNVEDMVPKKRSIRDVPIPENRRRINLVNDSAPARKEAVDIAPPPRMPPTPPREEYTYTSPQPRGGRKVSAWLGAIAVVLILALAGFSLFGGATLTYVPRTAELAFSNNSYTAVKSAEPGSGKLLFSVIQLTGDKSASAPATGSEQVSVKAQGTIVVYNNYSSEPQKLIANTRFQTTDGKIYRIKSGITVPGKKTSGTGSQPGSIETQVVADQPGTEYNIGLSDFTLPGLKDSPQYSSVYARSKTSMTGGFVGTRGKVGESDMAKAKSLLEDALKIELQNQARAQVPPDFILFPDLSQITYDAPTTGSSTATGAVVSEHANFTGVIFKKSELAAFLADQKVDKDAPVGPVEITDFSKIEVASSGSKSDLLGATSITFQINGSATLLWTTNEASLASDLSGKKKAELSNILKNYPSILSASATVRPFWKSSFPNDPKKIKIQANAAKQ
ncbi:hypothetical protein KW785_02535 [Candidatus Parcubacteria bacterium]|nr:hypothetical protein [Candidatus Parcubacteria bacterium]